MATVTLNGRSVGMTEYVGLIIEAARKIIEREQGTNGRIENVLDKSDLSVVSTDEKSADPPGDDLVLRTPGRPDPSAVYLRLPDGSLQTVEEYIIGIIKHASSQIEKDKQDTSVTGTLDLNISSTSHKTPEKSQIDYNSQTNCNSCEKAASAETSEKASDSTKQSGAVSQVFHKLFKRGKSKENHAKARGSQSDSPSTDQETSERHPDPSPNNNKDNVISEEITSVNHVDQNSIAQDKQEIPKRKGKLKKKNSLRNVLSCFSSKSAQSD